MENEKRLIFAEDLITAIRDDPNIDGEHFARMKRHINDAPAVETEKVIHAYWAGDEPGDWHCSHCGEYAADGGFEQTKRCPNCGAKMRGNEE